MYRLGFAIFMVLAIALGLLIGTLNHEVVSVDLLWTQLSWPLGLLLLAALTAGIFIGLILIWIFRVLPLRLQLKKARKMQAGNSGFIDSPDV